MKIQNFKFKLISVLTLLTIFLFSCNRDKITREEQENTLKATESNSLLLKAGTVDLPGRTLAANCFQCHGTNGYAGELKIAGQSTSGFVEKFNSMKAQDPRANIMNVHASAYTVDEVKLIGDFFSKQ